MVSGGGEGSVRERRPRRRPGKASLSEEYDKGLYQTEFSFCLVSDVSSNAAERTKRSARRGRHARRSVRRDSNRQPTTHTQG